MSKKDRQWKVTFTMSSPYCEGMIMIWAETAEKAISDTRNAVLNIQEIRSVVLTAMG